MSHTAKRTAIAAELLAIKYRLLVLSTAMVEVGELDETILNEEICRCAASLDFVSTAWLRRCEVKP